MPTKHFCTNISELSNHRYLRLDEKFWFTTKNLAVYKFVPLKDIFDIENGNSYTEFYTTKETNIPYIRIGDLSFKYEINKDNLIYLDDSCEIKKSKILRKDDLILATIGATIGKINLAREFEGGTFSNNTVVLRLKDKQNHDSYFYEKLFQSKLLQKYIWGIVSQKAQPNLQVYDLQNLKIPLIAYPDQSSATIQIEPIEKTIKKLKSQILPLQETIDNIFAREFGFDLAKVRKVDDDNRFYCNISQLGPKNSNIRFSYRWNQLGRVQEELYRSTKDIRILGNYIISTKNGWSPECNNGESGQAVLGIDAIQKAGKLDFSNPKFTQQTRGNITEFIVKDGDFLVSRGNTIDLVALASVAETQEDGQDCIYPDLMIKVEFDEKQIDKEYMAFLFNSVIGRTYFKYSAKGKNQTMVKISAKELYDFRLPVPAKDVQQKLVKEIEAELEKQESIKKKIGAERNKIDGIIEKVLANI